jgi:predicted O-methyltransferase YrrM
MKPSVETYQATWELDILVAIVGKLKPRRVLEVGCWKGGTLWHWLQVAEVVVAVDDQMRNVGDWFVWAAESGAELFPVHGQSQNADTIEEVDEHGPYDFVFIDGDHTYEAVFDDWKAYGPMVAADGCIAFHDILPRPNYGVSDVWAQVKDIEGVQYIEIAQNKVEPGNEGRCGIGVAWLP